MKTKPLTKAERDWIKKLQTVLAECPSDRLGAYTIGDRVLHIYDSRFEARINEICQSGTADFCSAVSHLQVDLATLRTPFPVHSTAG